MIWGVASFLMTIYLGFFLQHTSLSHFQQIVIYSINSANTLGMIMLLICFDRTYEYSYKKQVRIENEV